jgi:hypothetical protein
MGKLRLAPVLTAGSQCPVILIAASTMLFAVVLLAPDDQMPLHSQRHSRIPPGAYW